MSAYEQYRQVNAGWIAQVPLHWEAIPVKYVCTYNDEVLSEAADPEALIEYVEISDVDGSLGLKSSEVMPYKTAPSRARRIVKDGDVIISTVRTYLRAVAPIINPPANLVVSTGFAVIRPERLTSGFARYALVAEGFVGSVIARSTGVSYPAINASDLVRIPIPVPPIEEQTAIAANLDAETKRIDQLIKAKEQLVEKVVEMKVVAGFELATKGLNSGVQMKKSGIEWIDGVPTHWQVKRNMFLFRERNESGIDGLPILKVSLHTGVTEDDEDEDQGAARLRKQMEDKSAYKLTRKGDVAYNMMRAWQGAIGAVPVDGLVSPAYVVLTSEDIDADYFELLARTPCYKKDFERFSYGIASFRWRLYWEGFKEIKTPVPPIEEQRLIVAEYRKIASAIDELKKHIEDEILLLRSLRSSTITDAVLGRIDLRKTQAH